MDKIIEFASAHYLLVSAFSLLLAYFFALESRRAGTPVSPQQATNLVNREEGVILDVRDTDEFRQGHIAGSINIPSSQLVERLAELDKYKDKPLIITCKGGPSASAAGKILKPKGFTRLMRLQGGVQAWRDEKLPVVKA
ncbi:MAG: rhodanese-like domain-containing protein [Alcanivoracaceae bacterium]|nr:rhodanese-like domain-containing protein [Alcanivoracaceae bacterium]